MITAIPVDGTKIASHFKKAPQFALFDQQGQQLALFDNPANGDGGCSNKAALLAKFQQHQVERVIVRNIGERMLGRLLADNLKISRTNNARLPLETIATAGARVLTPLIYPSQGRKSINHAIKHANGGCHGEEGHSCCSNHGHGDKHDCEGGRCCQTKQSHKAPKLTPKLSPLAPLGATSFGRMTK